MNKGIGRFNIYKMIINDRFDLNRKLSDSLNDHLTEAIQWLCRAQDATPDDGFARAYNLMSGWQSSYPETTGYIVPTLIKYHNKTGDREILERCIRASDWLLSLQFPEGGIQAGTIKENTGVPTIFNTGQVIFAWVAAYNETKNTAYLDAINRACNWLAESQDDDGAWRKHGSVVTRCHINIYNTRTAWAMMLGGQLLDAEKYRLYALRNIEWALDQIDDRGVFDDNCTQDQFKPLTHTVAYTIRGILEIGLATENEHLLNIASKSAKKVLDNLSSSGFLPGRFDKNWKPNARYNCLTGACQMSIIWLKLYELGKDGDFFDGAQKAVKFVASTQDLETSNLGIKGGVKGSYPVNGEYCKFEYVNWAAKFFIDSVLLWDEIDQKDK
ncbi:MAG: hypothetical protein JRJ62_14300 [Deltaproteobacteria bacterium]|nr:hypothetical protein [Deltaproteobacteria bacterium]